MPHSNHCRNKVMHCLKHSFSGAEISNDLIKFSEYKNHQAGNTVLVWPIFKTQQSQESFDRSRGKFLG